MGANTSQVSDLSDNPSLKSLVGTESISENDPFWNQLISFTFISPTSRYTNTNLEMFCLCPETVKSNRSSVF